MLKAYLTQSLPCAVWENMFGLEIMQETSMVISKFVSFSIMKPQLPGQFKRKPF